MRYLSNIFQHTPLSKFVLAASALKKMRYVFLITLLGCHSSFALSGYEYMQRFLTFLHWSENLPSHPEPSFVQFIEDKRPLANRLRERWLYKLALAKDWQNYTRYYRPSNDLSLQCYMQIGRFNTGFHDKAALEGKKIWLTGGSLPPACDAMFNLLKKNNNITDSLITQRIILALDAKNVTLASYLLKQLSPPRNQDALLLEEIDRNPLAITKIHTHFLRGELFLYGVKKLIQKDMDKAISLSTNAHRLRIISGAQYQVFLAQIALFKAMRDSPDTLIWFSKVQKAYYNDALLDWQIRYALKHRQWGRVESLIHLNRNINTPCWQYWLARSLEKRGEVKKAYKIYEKVAKERQYYGFLASIRIHQSPKFSHERTAPNPRLLSPYRVFIEKIRSLYLAKNTLVASRLINDFVSELSKDEMSAFNHWLSNDLKWEGKAVLLSNDNRLMNQLNLRFPTPHSRTVSMTSHHYGIPQELIYAIMRQESGFRSDVVSPAGAHGLMQLMPQTAKLVAKQHRIPLNDKRELFVSDKNIHLGVAYLNQLGKRFKNHPILMAAAYNAGPGQVNNWIKAHPPEQIDIWVETIPWIETRNYIKNVIAFYVVYQFRIKGHPNLAGFLQSYSYG